MGGGRGESDKNFPETKIYAFSMIHVCGKFQISIFNNERIFFSGRVPLKKQQQSPFCINIRENEAIP